MLHRLAVIVALAAAGVTACRGPRADVQPEPTLDADPPTAAPTERGAAAPPDADAGAPPGALSYEPVEADLLRRCDESRVPAGEICGDVHPDSTLGLKIRAGWYNRCEAGEIDAALSTALGAALRNAPAHRAAALLRQQDAWKRWAEAMARLIEENRWANVDHDTRQTSTLEGLLYLTEHHPLNVERLLYLRALAAGDAATIAARARAFGPAGKRGEAEIAHIRTRARALLPSAPSEAPESYPPPITRAELEKIVSLTAAIETESAALGPASCDWKPLGDELGGGCARAMTLYYLAVWNDDPFPR